MNVKVSNLISRTNETRYIKWHESWNCKCRLDTSAFNNKKGRMKINADVNAKNWLTICDTGFYWNPSNCEYECNKSCDVGEYW